MSVLKLERVMALRYIVIVIVVVCVAALAAVAFAAKSSGCMNSEARAPHAAAINR